ncbi:hypothetical protein HAX54_022842, partial [Datura stramonium]|nr:hypothetical protein [Datura stramonium]
SVHIIFDESCIMTNNRVQVEDESRRISESMIMEQVNAMGTNNSSYVKSGDEEGIAPVEENSQELNLPEDTQNEVSKHPQS